MEKTECNLIKFEEMMAGIFKLIRKTLKFNEKNRETPKHGLKKLKEQITIK